MHQLEHHTLTCDRLQLLLSNSPCPEWTVRCNQPLPVVELDQLVCAICKRNFSLNYSVGNNVLGVCVCAFVRPVKRGYTHAKYTSTGDNSETGDIPSSKKKALNLSKGDVVPPLEATKIHYLT